MQLLSRTAGRCCDLLSNFVSLTSKSNHITELSIVRLSCDLLSNFVSLTSKSNFFTILCKGFAVVICFQILYLWPVKAIFAIVVWMPNCCDLLSNFVSLTSKSNIILNVNMYLLVVICFQILYLWPVKAIYCSLINCYDRLWFAFKFCIFDQ